MSSSSDSNNDERTPSETSHYETNEETTCEETTPSERSPSESSTSDDHGLEMSGIEYPGKHDVKLGRGGDANSHAGNIKFRELVNRHKPRYVAASRTNKPFVAEEVVQIWRKLDPPGRFVIRSDPSLGDDSTWHDVGDKRARRKASQALREKDRSSEYFAASDPISQPAHLAMDSNRKRQFLQMQPHQMSSFPGSVLGPSMDRRVQARLEGPGNNNMDMGMAAQLLQAIQGSNRAPAVAAAPAPQPNQNISAQLANLDPATVSRLIELLQQKQQQQAGAMTEQVAPAPAPPAFASSSSSSSSNPLASQLLTLLSNRQQQQAPPPPQQQQGMPQILQALAAAMNNRSSNASGTSTPVAWQHSVRSPAPVGAAAPAPQPAASSTDPLLATTLQILLASVSQQNNNSSKASAAPQENSTSLPPEVTNLLRAQVQAQAQQQQQATANASTDLLGALQRVLQRRAGQ